MLGFLKECQPMGLRWALRASLLVRKIFWKSMGEPDTDTWDIHFSGL